MRKFRKKPIVIEAVQWTGDNSDDLIEFTQGEIIIGNQLVAVKTLEGIMSAQLGDWIIKGVSGEFYPCKPDIFELSYYEVNQ